MIFAPIALSVVTTNPSTPDLITAIIATIIFGIVYFIYSERRRRAEERKTPEEAGMIKHTQTNPVNTRTRTRRKFNGRYFAIALLLSLVSIVFGIDYFWTIPGTPPRDFFAGFVFVISGVIVIAFSLRSWVLYKIQEEYYSGSNS